MDSDDECPPDLIQVEDGVEYKVLQSEKLDLTPNESAAKTSEGDQQELPPGAVPVTILTGFLGAGKTTLLNYILTQDHGRRIAVIENEVGDSMDIEELIARDGADGSMLEDNLFELKNGCICCTVKDDLVITLENLLQRRNKFDYIIIETTGLANPGPVASVFWLDDALESALRLDAIVTLVDSKNIRRQLTRGSEVDTEMRDGDTKGEQQGNGNCNEAAMQVAYADRVLVNKIDLVSEEVLHDVVDRVRAINAVADIRCTERSTVDLAWVLDTKCFSPEHVLEVDPSLSKAPKVSSDKGKDKPTLSEESNQGLEPLEKCREKAESCADEHDTKQTTVGTSHTRETDCAGCTAASHEKCGAKACSVHDSAVGTFAVVIPGSLELARLERWLGSLVWDPKAGGTEVFRVKGLVSVEGRSERFVVQGVADLFEVAPAAVHGSSWKEGESRHCKIVFIGRHLSKDDLERGLRACMVK